MDYRANETKTLRFQTVDPSTLETITPSSTPTVNLVLDGTVGSALTPSGSAGDYSVAIVIPNGQAVGTTVQVKITWSYAGVTRVMYPPEMCGRVTVEQTGDAFARLGAPTGASVSADIASTHSRIGAPAAASIAADIDALPTASEIIAAQTNVYHADLQLTIDDTNTQDEWTVVWFKNGIRQTSGITSPQIQLVKRADGTDLLAATNMTQVGATGAYKYDASGSARITEGEAVLAVVTATIDAGTRTWAKVIFRDKNT